MPRFTRGGNGRSNNNEAEGLTYRDANMASRIGSILSIGQGCACDNDGPSNSEEPASAVPTGCLAPATLALRCLSSTS